MDSPRLPWEVIERVICHSGDHPNILRSLSLTCRQLRPRALCLIVGHVSLKSRDRIFDFCAALEAKPHLKPLVRSAVVDPTDFAPVPFLRILPNLSEIRFTSTETIVAIHQSNLTCFRHFGAHVHTLHLSNLYFASYLPLARVLLAFTNVVHLTCTKVKITTFEKQLPPLDVLKRRLSQRLRLRSLAVDHSSMIRWATQDVSTSGGLLLASDLAPTLESLRLIGMPIGRKPDAIPYSLGPRSDQWSRLQSLILELPLDCEPSLSRQVLPSGYESLPSAVNFFNNVHAPTLKQVTLVLGPMASIVVAVETLNTPVTKGQMRHVAHVEKLERALLRFSEPSIIWTMKNPLRTGRNSFWVQELGRRFPTLSQRGALVLRSETVLPMGHDGALHALVICPTGKRVASGSEDFTIILWDITGHIVQQWVAHDYKHVLSLAFSPDGQLLVSGGGDARLAIWHLDHLEGVRKVAVLEGHAGPVSSCAWSPDGTMIASGSLDGTVRLWDVHTFSPLRVLKRSPAPFKAQYFTFSPDGRWLASWSFPSSYCLWDVATGALHKFIQPELTGRVQRLDIAAAFDPGSTRLATVSRWDGVEVWDVETGTRQVVLRHADEVQDVSFSCDGRLLVTASSDRTVKIWDAYTGDELLRLLGHTYIVSKACFSPCGKYVASGSWDGTVRLWRTRDGSSLGSFSEHLGSFSGHEGYATHVFFSPDGKTLCSGAKNGSVVFRSMNDIIPTEEQDS